jgi:LEA14-like dessication related protein
MSSEAALLPGRPRKRGPGIAALLIAAGLSACSSLDRADADLPDVSLAGLSFAEAGLFEQAFTVQLRMRNPNDFDIPVDGLDFVLDVNGARFAEGLSSKDFVLPASAEVIVPIEVAISTNDLIERVTAIGTGRRLDYQLTGSAALASWFTQTVPFQRSGKLALPDIPGLFQEDPPPS